MEPIALHMAPTVCPFCLKEGRGGNVTAGTTSVGNAGMANSYFDTSGHSHVHDPNVHEQLFDCSNGHRFKTQVKKGCPTCQYNRPVQMTAVLIEEGQ